MKNMLRSLNTNENGAETGQKKKKRKFEKSKTKNAEKKIHIRENKRKEEK